jgi:hypothetical protein
MAATTPRTLAIGPLRLHVNRTDPEAAPLFLVYPLLNRLRGKRGLLVTVWRRRFEARW